MANYHTLLQRAEQFEVTATQVKQQADELKGQGNNLKRRFIDQFIIGTEWDKQYSEWINRYTSWDIYCNNQITERSNQLNDRAELLKIVPQDTYLYHLKGRDHLANSLFDLIVQLSNELKQFAFQLKQQKEWVKQLLDQQADQAQTIKKLSIHIVELDTQLRQQSEQLTEQAQWINQLKQKNAKLQYQVQLNTYSINMIQPVNPVYDYQAIKSRKQKLHCEFKRLSKLMKLG